MARCFFLFLLAICCVSTLACGDGDSVGPTGTVVGGPCTPQSGCAMGSSCQTGGDFPGGTCTVPCLGDGDCPLGTACVDKEAGICLLACTYPEDCRLGYTCKGKKRASGGGEVLVCIED